MNNLTRQATQNYQKAQIESASPEKLVLMLYDGAVQKLSLALGSLERKDLSDFTAHVVRVQKIISELMGALDHETGGEVAVNLTRIYDYMIRQLALALLKKEEAPVTEVRTLLEELREGWQAAVAELAEASAESENEGSQPERKAEAERIQTKMLEPVMVGFNIQG